MSARLGGRPILKRFSVNLAAQSYSATVTIATQLLVLPAMLALWGPERYGAWLIIVALPAYLSLADLGFAQIAGNEMTMRVARGDRDGAVCVGQTAWLMVGSVSLALVVLAGLFSALFPIADVFHITDFAEEVPLATFLLACVVVGSLVFGAVGAAMRANGLFWQMVATTTTMRITDALALVVVAVSGGGFVAAAAAMLGLRIVLLLASSFRFYPEYTAFRPAVRRADLRVLRSMLRPSLAYMSVNASMVFNIQGANLIVGAVLGPAAVVIVSAIRTLSRMGRMTASLGIGAIEPIFAELAGRSARQTGQAISSYLLMVALFGSLVFAGVMAWIGEPFLVWWTHGVASGRDGLFQMMVVAVALEIIWYAWQTPYAATNRHAYFAGWSLATALLGLPLLAIGLHWFGIIAAGGVAILLSAAMLAVTALVARRLEFGSQPGAVVGEA